MGEGVRREAMQDAMLQQPQVSPRLQSASPLHKTLSTELLPLHYFRTRQKTWRWMQLKLLQTDSVEGQNFCLRTLRSWFLFAHILFESCFLSAFDVVLYDIFEMCQISSFI